ncbi:F0F1 ATP synthase subunit B [Terrilactibacillus sp. BCM23-1]|uniref:ATP synthase subunit b n=1 Tax=Terrilactibacillus tamarindi TaxID=2599694 RepID=A0A6N8CLZ5_9BACI|nr:F0F1 ATP synthase subunit B [Terrilactibacillus tamarindi]MTT30999.1 F0F1 ATP synthase subunit B [Terrilactibacillus tamarindi]
MLEFHLGTILFQLVVFIILMIIIGKIGTKPVVEMMRKRQNFINEQINSAETSRKEAEAFLAEQKSELDKVRQEAHSIIERAKKQGESEADSIISAAKDRADRLVAEARVEITREKDLAIASLRDEVADLSVLLATKILEKEIDAKQYDKEMNQVLKEVGERL